MLPPSQKPEQPLTAAQLDAWVHHASLKRRQLLLTGTAPSHSIRAQAFLEMGTLCLDALEEVRAISAQLREESREARFKAQEIVAESAQLLAQHTPLTASQVSQILQGDQQQQEPPG